MMRLALWLEAYFGRLLAWIACLVAGSLHRYGFHLAALFLLVLVATAFAHVWDTDTRPEHGDD